MNKRTEKRMKDDMRSKSTPLSSLIALVCIFSVTTVVVASLIFYSDPHSKYDLVRPGRRNLPESFYVQNSNSQDVHSKEDLLLQLQDLSETLNGLEIYGEFDNDALSDYKVFQEYLTEVVPE